MSPVSTNRSPPNYGAEPTLKNVLSGVVNGHHRDVVRNRKQHASGFRGAYSVKRMGRIATKHTGLHRKVRLAMHLRHPWHAHPGAPVPMLRCGGRAHVHPAVLKSAQGPLLAPIDRPSPALRPHGTGPPPIHPALPALTRVKRLARGAPYRPASSAARSRIRQSPSRNAPINAPTAGVPHRTQRIAGVFGISPQIHSPTVRSIRARPALPTHLMHKRHGGPVGSQSLSSASISFDMHPAPDREARGHTSVCLPTVPVPNMLKHPLALIINRIVLPRTGLHMVPGRRPGLRHSGKEELHHINVSSRCDSALPCARDHSGQSLPYPLPRTVGVPR